MGEQANKVRTELHNKLKELELKLKKAQEEGFIKERLLGASKNEADNLTNLIAFLEEGNQRLRASQQSLSQGFVE